MGQRGKERQNTFVILIVFVRMAGKPFEIFGREDIKRPVIQINTSKYSENTKTRLLQLTIEKEGNKGFFKQGRLGLRLREYPRQVSSAYL